MKTRSRDASWRKRRMRVGFWLAYISVVVISVGATIGALMITGGIEAESQGAYERVQTRNAFFESLQSGGMERTDNVGELSRSVAELLNNPRTQERNPLSASTLDEVYLAPGIFEGVEGELGEDVFEGITTEKGAEVCQECGAFTDTFNNHVRAAWAGDLEGIVTAPPERVDYPQDMILLAGVGGLLLAPVAGVLGATNSGRRRSDGSALEAYQELNFLDKTAFWLLAWAPMLVWRVGSSFQAWRKGRVVRRRAQEAQKKAVLEEMLDLGSNPFASELLRARANLGQLRKMESTQTVRQAISATEKLIEKLERVPQDYVRQDQEQMAETMLEDSIRENERLDKINQARGELDALEARLTGRNM